MKEDPAFLRPDACQATSAALQPASSALQHRFRPLEVTTLACPACDWLSKPNAAARTCPACGSDRLEHITDLDLRRVEVRGAL